MSYPRIVISVRGGLVSAVYSRKPLDVLIVDHDNEEVGENAAGPCIPTVPLKQMSADTRKKVKEYDA